jgi:hypothetical protein
MKRMIPREWWGTPGYAPNICFRRARR